MISYHIRPNQVLCIYKDNELVHEIPNVKDEIDAEVRIKEYIFNKSINVEKVCQTNKTTINEKR